jgi:hypothetical protein
MLQEIAKSALIEIELKDKKDTEKKEKEKKALSSTSPAVTLTGERYKNCC